MSGSLVTLLYLMTAVSFVAERVYVVMANRTSSSDVVSEAFML